MSQSQTHTADSGATTDRPVLGGDLPTHGVELADLTEALETDLQADTILVQPCIYWCPPTPVVEEAVASPFDT